MNRYVEHTALSNPHATVHYLRPRQARISFPRATEELPKEAVEIKPHPHGVELGALMLMAADSKAHDVRGFLQTAFSRVSGQVADEIVKRAAFKGRVRPRDVAEDRVLAEKLHRAIGATKIMNPPTNCLSPIGDELMKRGLISFLNVIETEGPETDEQLDLDHAAKKKASRKEKAAKAAAPEVPDAPAEEGVEKIKGHNYFIATVTRPPKVYRGNPFQVEVGLAYGGSWPADKPIELFRFANRVPLLFQRGACGTTEAIVKTDWRNYLLSQPKGSLPVGPMALLVHIASVWVPFTSEAKEAVAHYPEIIEGDPARGAGVRPQARRAHPQEEARGLPGAAPQHLRALHPGGRAGAREDHGQEPGADQARVPAPRRPGHGGGPEGGGRGARGAVEKDHEAPAPGRERGRVRTPRLRARAAGATLGAFGET